MSPSITHALFLSRFRGSRKTCKRSSCKILASTLLFGWPRVLSHERLFLARAVAGHEKGEVLKRKTWVVIVNPWRWTETERYGHTTKSNFAACASGFCTVLDWGLSFYLKLSQKKKSHILFKLPCCGSFCCWSQQFPEEKQEHTRTGRQLDTRHTHGLSPSPDTHTSLPLWFVCFGCWLCQQPTVQVTNTRVRKHLQEVIAARVPPAKPRCACNCSAKTSRGGCCCVYAIIYKTRELHPSLWQL